VSRGPDVVVIGRVGADLPPDTAGVALEDVRNFTRFPGGYGGNVSTGLARLETRVAVVATVGDDGHGRFLRADLAREGVDVSALRLDPLLRTPLAFYEAWPPDHFPVTFYPSQAYWALEDWQLGQEVVEAPVWLVSATALACEPSRTLILDALARRTSAHHGRHTVLDLDWRPVLWEDPSAAPPVVERAMAHVDVVIGSEAEFTALGIDPVSAAAPALRAVYLKRGEAGARYLNGFTMLDAEPVVVETVCGLGSGDAFAAVVGEGLSRGRMPEAILRRANAAGAIVATRLTCSDAMPTNVEIDEVLE
jgi:5-dehydro-2-deoxygluconokinase